jgi:Na+/phosphate symporter
MWIVAALLSIAALIYLLVIGYVISFYIMIAVIIGAALGTFIPRSLLAPKFFSVPKLQLIISIIIAMTIFGLIFWFKVIPSITTIDITVSQKELFENAKFEFIYSGFFGFSYMLLIKWLDIVGL